jgi:primosomal protein N' (replication factor Y) (superfamily II helicase)
MQDNLESLIAEVILDQKVGKILDYHIPDHLKHKITPGSRVKIPLKNKLAFGTILTLKSNSNFKKLKYIEDVAVDVPALPQDLMKLAEFMKKYYLTSYHKIFKSMIFTCVRKNIKPQLQLFLSLKKSKAQTLKIIPEIRKKSIKQTKILEVLLKKEKGLFLTELLDEIKDISNAPIYSLIKKNILNSVKLNPNHFEAQDYFLTPDKKLNHEQMECFEKIKKDLIQKTFQTHLIYGVTGSGKTEIYIHLIRHCLEKKSSAILLLPEITITEQMIERFKSRFPNQIAVLHYKRSQGERYDAIDKITKNDAMLVIGARSAVFAPTKNLALIIVDEEHEMSYKQSDEMPYYNARDLAIVRGKICNIPVVLGSATPSLESYYNAINQKYSLSKLTKRASNSSLPNIELINMKQEYEKNGGFTHFSSLLINKIKSRFQKNEQVIIFLNRRGYYTSFTCQNCSEILKCKNCDLALTYHKAANIMRCHLCAYETPFTNRCIKCSSNLLKYKGFGTEHVERSLKGLFPECRIARLDRDTTTRKNSHEKILKEFKSQKKDILIGTQMIAKGLHFPSVTLVGILNGDASLFIPDYKAAENAFQLLTQVSGRAGRDETLGEVIIQTMNLEHPVIQMAKDQSYEKFYNYEIESREMFHFPPFYKLWKLIFSDTNDFIAQKNANIIYQELNLITPKEYIIQPVSNCAHIKVKNTYRYQIIIHGKKINPLNAILDLIKSKFYNISFKIDVNCSSTFF